MWNKEHKETGALNDLGCYWVFLNVGIGFHQLWDYPHQRDLFKFLKSPVLHSRGDCKEMSFHFSEKIGTPDKCHSIWSWLMNKFLTISESEINSSANTRLPVSVRSLTYQDWLVCLMCWALITLYRKHIKLHLACTGILHWMPILTEVALPARWSQWWIKICNLALSVLRVLNIRVVNRLP